MQANNIGLEVIRETQLYVTPQYYHEVVSMVPMKENDLQKHHTEAFDNTNFELVKYLFNDVYNRYHGDLSPEMLLEALKKLYKLAYDIPTYITYSNFTSESREELLEILKKTNKLIVTFESKLKELKQHKRSEEVDVMQKWQWNEGLARELLMELESIGNDYFQRYNYTQAEEYYKDCLLLASHINKMSGKFDPGLQAEEKRLADNVQLTQNKKIQQLNNMPKQQDAGKNARKIFDEIDACSGISLPVCNPAEMYIHKVIEFNFDNPTFKDTEFSNPAQLLYSDVKLQRFPLSQMRKIDPTILKPSNLTKHFEKNSALLASLTSIVYKNKESLKEVFYPRMPHQKIPLYNPYGKYAVRLYLNGAYKQITVDDFMILTKKREHGPAVFNSEMDFFFSLVHKSFQKLKHLGMRIDKDPSIYNWMLMGPNWIPEKILFSPMHDKFHFYWDLIKKVTTAGILIARRKPVKQNPFIKRVFYNVHTVLEFGNYRILVMQNISQADGPTISERLKLQVDDVGGNQQVYEKVLGYLADQIKEHNGMFLTSYPKFLENFDYGYINWKVTTPITAQNMNYQQGIEPTLFNHCYAVHRKDALVVSSDIKFSSLDKNPQFKVKIAEQYEDTVLFVLLQHHSSHNDTQKQLAFEVFPRRSSKVSLLSGRSSSIQTHYKRQVGQKFILSKLHLNHQHDGNEISIVMTYHSRSLKLDPNDQKDPTEDLAYTLYFYSMHRIQVEELKNELGFVQNISSETLKELSSCRTDAGFVNCPQFSIQPKIDYPKQKFVFQMYLFSNKDNPLSFNIYDTSYLPNQQFIYGHSPLYTSSQETENINFLEGEFIINPPDLTKLNIQVIPMHDKIPKQIPYSIALHTNLKCDFVEIPYDDKRFETYEFKGVWNHTNAGGSMEHYKANPKYLIHTFGSTWMRVQIISVSNPQIMVNATLYPAPFEPNQTPNFDIFSTKNLALTTTKEEYQGVKRMSYTNDAWRQVSDFAMINGGNYILIPSTLEQGVFGEYIVKLHCSSKITFKEYHVVTSAS